MVSDVNLPAAQLQIAMGIPLYRIKSIRTLYRLNPWDNIPIDFENPPNPPTPWGHVIAARITSENPEEGFKVILIVLYCIFFYGSHFISCCLLLFSYRQNSPALVQCRNSISVPPKMFGVTLVLQPLADCMNSLIRNSGIAFLGVKIGKKLAKTWSLHLKVIILTFLFVLDSFNRLFVIPSY